MTKKQSKSTKQANAQRAAERAAAIRREQETKERRRRTLVVSLAVLAVLAVVVVIAVAVQSGRDTTGQASTPPDQVVDKYALPYGEADAPVQVTVYEDFMCPFCGDFEAASRAALQKDVDAGKVQLRYHVLNFLDDRSTSDYSTRAANAYAAVLDAAGPQAAKEFHDLLFENQPEEGSAGLSDRQLLDYAVQAGAPRATVSRAIEARTFEQWVDNGTEQASKDGVNATPTVQVDGKTVTYTTIDELAAEVERAVAAK
jgi:protein-disulfide isomerase